eukprot:tig00000443_g787.t1
MSVAVPLFTYAASVNHKGDHTIKETTLGDQATETPYNATAVPFSEADLVRVGELRCDKMRTREGGSAVPGRVKTQRLTVTNGSWDGSGHTTNALTFNNADGEANAALYVQGGGANVVGGLRVNGAATVTGVVNAVSELNSPNITGTANLSNATIGAPTSIATSVLNVKSKDVGSGQWASLWWDFDNRHYMGVKNYKVADQATVTLWNDTAACPFFVAALGSTTGRSIAAGGTVNTAGSDYAEYMLKKSNDFAFNKGDICGVNGSGLLTNQFTEAVTFVVKSTNPSFVGGDTWGQSLGMAPLKPETDDPTALATYEAARAAWESAAEANRQLVDRIAFCGQVPVNVSGGGPGDYVVPTPGPNGAIAAQAVAAPSFDQYRVAVGRIIRVVSDTQALIIVKVV